MRQKLLTISASFFISFCEENLTSIMENIGIRSSFGPNHYFLTKNDVFITTKTEFNTKNSKIVNVKNGVRTALRP